MHIQNSSSIKNNWITFGGIDIVNPKKVIIEIPALDEFLANKKKRTLNIKNDFAVLSDAESNAWCKESTMLWNL